jgi:hypothetical protein
MNQLGDDAGNKADKADQDNSNDAHRLRFDHQK